MRLGDLDALKKEINTYDKFACLPDGKLYPVRELKHPEMFITYIHVDDVIKAIDNAPTVEPPKQLVLRARDDAELEQLKTAWGKGEINFTPIVAWIERTQGEWIPVSEKLPEQGNQSYLVTVDYGNGVVCSCQRFFFNEDIGWNDDCVIAWQPLPEPFQKGE